MRRNGIVGSKVDDKVEDARRRQAQRTEVDGVAVAFIVYFGDRVGLAGVGTAEDVGVAAGAAGELVVEQVVDDRVVAVAADDVLHVPGAVDVESAVIAVAAAERQVDRDVVADSGDIAEVEGVGAFAVPFDDVVFFRAVGGNEGVSVITVTALEMIGTGRVGNFIVTVAALDPVVAVAALDVVVTADEVRIGEIAVDDIVAVAGVDIVVADAALDVVVTVAAFDIVVAVVTADVVVAVESLDDVVAGAAGDVVVAVAAVDGVFVVFAADVIVAVAAAEGVVAGAAGDGVVAVAALDVVVVVAALEPVVAVAAVDRVATVAAGYNVVAVAAVDRVDAVAAGDVVVAVAAVEFGFCGDA